MTRLAGLWNRLEDAEKVAFFYAAKHVLDERGAQIVLAITAHAEDHLREAPRPPAVDHGSGTRVIDARHVRLVCHDCRQVITGKPHAWLVRVDGANRPLWLDYLCYRDRLSLNGTTTWEAS